MAKADERTGRSCIVATELAAASSARPASSSRRRTVSGPREPRAHLVGAMPFGDEEPIRFGDREAAQHDRVEQGEDRRGATDPERERPDRRPS